MVPFLASRSIKRSRTRREESMQPTPTAVELLWDAGLQQALLGEQVVGTLTYGTACGRTTLTHAYADLTRINRIEASRGPSLATP